MERWLSEETIHFSGIPEYFRVCRVEEPEFAGLDLLRQQPTGERESAKKEMGRQKKDG